MKKRIWNLIAAIVQLIIGIFAITSFAILAINGEEIAKWIPAALLSTVFVVLGLIGIKEFKSKS